MAVAKPLSSAVAIVLLLSAATLTCAEGPPGELGYSSCPCLSLEEVMKMGYTTLVNTDRYLGNHIDVTTYGVGCGPHDETGFNCLDQGPHCSRAWCYVDRKSCALSTADSIIFKGRTYSYATCGEIDKYTSIERRNSLKGKTFRVGFMSNSGGWKGSYNPDGSFAINRQWRGPTVEFVREAATVGVFTVNMTFPPDWLRSGSQKFFGNSSFDFCVYATSLGYLDFCVGGFSFSSKRTSITSMFEMTADPVYLVLQTEENLSPVEKLVAQTLTVFRPFTAASWGTIFLFVLPILSILMFYHEYESPGSSFPRTQPVLTIKNRIQDVTVAPKQIRRRTHVVGAFYAGMLSLFTGSAGLNVVTAGGKITLLGLSSCVLLVTTAYTANLASIFTISINKPQITTIHAAVDIGYNFCAERKLAEFLMAHYDVPPSRIVPDPISLGGDGKPGFDCPNCKARQRVLDSMRSTAVENDTLYCKAAVLKIEDLEVMQSKGKHCDKIRVGDSLGYRTIGFPINEKYAPALNALFFELKNEGRVSRYLKDAKPKSICQKNEGLQNSLSPEELTGVWVLVFVFAVSGVLVRFYKDYKEERSEDTVASRKKLRKYDQWLNPPGYDVIVNGYRYDGENNTIVPVEEDSSGISYAGGDGDDPIEILDRRSRQINGGEFVSILGNES